VSYATDKAALLAVFPRGRMTRTEDGACVLRARRRARARDEVYVYGPGKLGVMYAGTGQVYRKRLQGLTIDELPCDREGIVYVRAVPDVAERLPWFSKNKPHNPEGIGKFVRHSSRATSGAIGASGLTTGQGEGSQAPQEVTP
jgi:hypothetical protein